MEPFEIVIKSDEDAEVQKLLRSASSDDEMVHFLKYLSQAQIAELAQDREGLQALYEKLQAVHSQPGRHYLARIQGGDFVGWVTVKGAGAQIPELQVEILPPYRRQGYGRALLRYVIQDLFQHTAATCLRYCTGPYNEASMGLVRSLGGVLQEPISTAEKLLLRTFYIYPEVGKKPSARHPHAETSKSIRQS